LIEEQTKSNQVKWQIKKAPRGIFFTKNSSKCRVHYTRPAYAVRLSCLEPAHSRWVTATTLLKSPNPLDRAFQLRRNVSLPRLCHWFKTTINRNVHRRTYTHYRTSQINCKHDIFREHLI